MRKPVPMPRRRLSRSRGVGRLSGTEPPSISAELRSRESQLEMESILTTAGLTRSATSAKETGVEAAAAGTAASIGTSPGDDIAGAGVSEPAITRPSSTPTVPLRQITATRNRRIGEIIRGSLTLRRTQEREQRRLLEDRHAQLLCLVRIAARVCPHDHARRLLAHGTSNLAAQPLDRRCGLLAAHRDECSGNHVGP